MDDKEFEAWTRLAETRRGMATTPEEARFYQGYLLGLQRAHHGEAYLDEAEHQANLAAALDEADPDRRFHGQGYKAGFNAVDPITALGMIL